MRVHANLSQGLSDLRALLIQHYSQLAMADYSDFRRVLCVNVENDPTFDIAQWLSTETTYPKIYWRSRDCTDQFVGVGCAREWLGAAAFRFIETAEHRRDNARYYWLSSYPGGVIDEGIDLAENGHESRVYAPMFEVVVRQSYLSLGINVTAEKPVESYLEILDRCQWHIDQLPLMQALPRPESTLSKVDMRTLERMDVPTFQHWQSMVSHALSAFAQGSLKKVVLARQTRLTSAQLIPFWEYFNRWQGLSENCFNLAYQASASVGFMSFTPERLFKRNRRQIITEAMAGTNRRGSTLDMDEASGRSLLSDRKNAYEHQLVIDDIRQKLDAIALDVAGGQVVLSKQRNIQHLYYPLTATLLDGVQDADIIRHLHPTAAVAGFPQASAAELIEQLEPEKRGQYAGLCGLIDADNSEFAVTIRSATLEDNEMTLFAGAGIVPGSTAAKEWHELEDKISIPLSILSLDLQPAESASVLSLAEIPSVV